MSRSRIVSNTSLAFFLLCVGVGTAEAAPPKGAPAKADAPATETPPETDPADKGFSGDPVLDIVDRAPEKAAEQSDKERPVEIAPTLDPENVYGKACKVQSDCMSPGTCVERRCKAPSHEIRELARKGKNFVVAGGTVLGFGLALGVAGTIIVATASAVDSRDDQDVAPGSFESGYTLLGLGVGGILSGAIVLGIGRSKLRKVEAYDRLALRVRPILFVGRGSGHAGVQLRF